MAMVVDLETFDKRRWYKKLCCFYNVYKSHSPKYLFNIIPDTVSTYNAIQSKTSFFKIPLSVLQSLNDKIWTLIFIIQKVWISSGKVIHPSRRGVFNCYNPRGVKLLTRLRLGLRHLREHKFKHGFRDTFNPIFTFGNHIETVAHFFLPCPYYSNERPTFLNTTRNINGKFFDKNDLQITETLLYGDSF